jgi:hypothetical protein
MSTLIDNPERAVRVARTIASDIALYNEKKIVKGITEDTFFTELADAIEEGREHYRARLTPELYQSTNHFDRAVVDIILKQQGRRIASKIW